MGRPEKIFNASVDVILILHLKNDIQRKRNVDQLKEQLISNNIRVINAVTPDSSEFLTRINPNVIADFPPCFRCKKLSCDRKDCNNFLIPSQVACAETHLKALQMFLASNEESVLILEDDVTFHSENANKSQSEWADILSILQSRKEPILIKLGAAWSSEYHSFKSDSKTPQVIIDDNYLMANPAYAVNRSGAQQVVQALSTSLCHTADVIVHKLSIPGLQRISVHPLLYSDLSWSNGKIESSIHPKAIRGDYLEKSLQKSPGGKAAERLRQELADWKNNYDTHIKSCIVKNREYIRSEGCSRSEIKNRLIRMLQPFWQMHLFGSRPVIANTYMITIPHTYTAFREFLSVNDEIIVKLDQYNLKRGWATGKQEGKNSIQRMIMSGRKIGNVSLRISEHEALKRHGAVAGASRFLYLLSEGDFEHSEELIGDLFANTRVFPKQILQQMGRTYKRCSQRDVGNQVQARLEALLPYRDIAIITVNFNNVNGLRRTIESVKGQRHKERTRFVIVDGGSTDGSLELIRQNLDVVDLVIAGRDRGPYDAMNHAQSVTEAYYSIYMNSGDRFYSQNSIADLLQHAHINAWPDVIYGNTKVPSGEMWYPKPLDLLWRGQCFCHQSAIVRSEYVKKFCFDQGWSIVADFVQLYRIYNSGALFSHIDATIAEIEPPGMSSDFMTRTIERWIAVRELQETDGDRAEVDEFYSSFVRSGESFGAHQYDPERNKKSEIENRLVFLLSMPRSGSTLVQRMLERSPDISSASEPWVMLPVLSMLNDTLIKAKYGQKFAVNANSHFMSEMGGRTLFMNAVRSYSDTLYGTLLNRRKEWYFLDKTPRYMYILNDLIRLYPNSKYILLLRHPADIACSYADTWCNGDLRKILCDEHLKADFTDALPKLAEAVASDFRNSIVVRYEDIVVKPWEEMERICKYLGISCLKNMIEYNNEDRITKYKFGDPYTVYEKTKPDAKSVGRWRQRLKYDGESEKLFAIMDLIPDFVFSSLGYSRPS